MSVNDSLSALTEQIAQITAMLKNSEAKREELEMKLNDAASTSTFQTPIIKTEPGDGNCDEPDIEPNITSGNDIQLEAYKAIPEFSGKQHEYRSWRNQVYRRMKIINDFKDHPKYEAALAIIRAKITGGAADILTNNKTPFNIICILKTLDAAYTDQRPLYAIEAQMVAIKQGDKSLLQYFNAVNFALNAIISKVVMSYNEVGEQRSLIAEAQKKAIRTFIVGLKFKTMRHILYGQQPKTLNEAFTIAQTVFYDNEHLQLEQCSLGSKTQQSKPYMNNNKQRIEWNQQKTCDGPTSMEANGSNRTKRENWRQPEAVQKKEYQWTKQRFEQPTQNKMQRINNLTEAQPIPEEESDGNESDGSNESTNDDRSSAFLDE